MYCTLLYESIHDNLAAKVSVIASSQYICILYNKCCAPKKQMKQIHEIFIENIFTKSSNLSLSQYSHRQLYPHRQMVYSAFSIT